MPRRARRDKRRPSRSRGDSARIPLTPSARPLTAMRPRRAGRPMTAPPGCGPRGCGGGVLGALSPGKLLPDQQPATSSTACTCGASSCSWRCSSFTCGASAPPENPRQASHNDGPGPQRPRFRSHPGGSIRARHRPGVMPFRLFWFRGSGVGRLAKAHVDVLEGLGKEAVASAGVLWRVVVPMRRQPGRISWQRIAMRQRQARLDGAR
jgi:hypothetical protein